LIISLSFHHGLHAAPQDNNNIAENIFLKVIWRKYDIHITPTLDTFKKL